MPEQKKFDLSPSVAILVAGATIAGAILLTHFFPAAKGATAAQGNEQPTLQQQMSPALYLAMAKELGADETKYQACVDAKKHQAKIDADSAEAQKAGGQGTPFTVFVDTKTKKQLAVSGALPYEQLKLAVDAINTEGVPLSIRPPSATDHIIGAPDSPIVMVEFSDFQCPYCQMIHPSLQKLAAESNGKIAWVYRNFPLYTIHPQATPAANAAECIAEQLGNDAFWKFADAIFEG